MGSFPAGIRNLVLYVLKKILYLDEVNTFIEKHNHKTGLEFLDEIFEMLDFSYAVPKKDRDRIPSEGRLVIISNHPLGALDGLALIKMVSEVRKDVKIIVNDYLFYLDNLKEFFLPFDVLVTKQQRENLVNIKKALQNEEALIIFPAGAVSRMSWNGIQDLPWTKGALYFAKKMDAPILPVFVHAKNSALFYTISTIYQKAAMLLLPHEMFNKKGKIIRIDIGDPIPAEVFKSGISREKVQLKLLRKHLNYIGRRKKGVFDTYKTIIHPVDKKALIEELKYGEQLGETEDKKKITLVDYDTAPEVLREIGRLREITFRKVGEGTGSKIDLDKFDKYYKHIVLWDEKELEIVGSYRLGLCKEIIEQKGVEGLYTSTLFQFNDEFVKYLPESIEMGRSFVQQKYWNTFALGYLWYGIGAFLAKNPQYKYMFGGVSLSNTYTSEAKNLIIYFYKKWFGSDENLAKANKPFTLHNSIEKEMRDLFDGDFMSDQKTLKRLLKIQGFTIPTLYRQYADLCDDNGVKFLEFGIDYDFQECIDAFILVSIDKLKESKKERFIYRHLQELRSAI